MKSLEYGKSEVGQVICAYARDDLTNVIIPEEGTALRNPSAHIGVR